MNAMLERAFVAATPAAVVDAVGAVPRRLQRVVAATEVDRMVDGVVDTLKRMADELGDAAEGNPVLSLDAQADLVLAATFVARLATEAASARATLRRRWPRVVTWGEV